MSVSTISAKPQFIKSETPRGEHRLIEIVSVSHENFGDEAPAPLQLFRFLAKQQNDDKGLWILSGFEGGSKVDGYVVNLLQKALARNLFHLHYDVYLTPVMNPSGILNSNARTHQGVDLNTNFDTKRGGEAQTPMSLEAKTLCRWATLTKPRAIITFTSGPKSFLRHLDIPANIIEKIRDLTEIPVVEFGSEPEAKTEQGDLIPYRNLDRSFGHWCADQDIAWLDFHLCESKKSFEEVSITEWKLSIGPALKWLLEGPRFNPPQEEPALPKLQVIPVLEMPPEFANL